jgi:hypothetical protein
MRQLVAFEVASGQTVVAEVDDDEPGVERAARVDEALVRATALLDQTLEQVVAVAELAVGKLSDLSRGPDTVEVQFGIRLNAEAGAVIARTQAEGHLQVTLSWANPDSQGGR